MELFAVCHDLKWPDVKHHVKCEDAALRWLTEKLAADERSPLEVK